VGKNLVSFVVWWCGRANGGDVKAMATSENPLLEQKVPRDPILFSTAYKRSRFYLFSRDEPEA
jgi:hypothetical protein